MVEQAQQGALPDEGSKSKLSPGDTLGNYVIEARLGHGGEGVVYRARDVVLRRRVALKVLHHGAGSAQDGPNVRGLDEARILAEIDHPHIVRIYHAHLSGGVWYVTMECVDGGSLEEHVRRLGKLDALAALRFARDAADALHYLHELDILHCDIKPHNLLLSRAGSLKLTDFGLALAPQRARNSVVGTPHFIAPELWDGARPTPHSDIYALGICLYFMLVGRWPFSGSMDDIRTAHQTSEISLPDGTPSVVAEIMRHSLEKNPSDRPDDADAFRQACEDAIAELDGVAKTRRVGKRRVLAGDTTRDPFPELDDTSLLHANQVVPYLAPYSDVLRELVRAHEDRAPMVVLYGDRSFGQDLAISRLIETTATFCAVQLDIGLSSMPLVTALAQRLQLEGRETLQAVLDAIPGTQITETEPAVSTRTLLRIDAVRPLRTDDVASLLELARHIEKVPVTLLVSCDRTTADAIEAAARRTKNGALVRSIGVPLASIAELGEIVDGWTDVATRGRGIWSRDAIRLLAHLRTQGDRHIERSMHNAVMVARAAALNIITTWCVLGGAAHDRRIEKVEDVQVAWTKRPSVWPSEEAFGRSIVLRKEAASTHAASTFTTA